MKAIDTRNMENSKGIPIPGEEIYALIHRRGKGEMIEVKIKTVSIHLDAAVPRIGGVVMESVGRFPYRKGKRIAITISRLRRSGYLSDFGEATLFEDSCNR